MQSCGPQELLFSDARDLGEILTESAQRRCQTVVGQVTIGDFRPISRYVSETVQDKDIITTE